MKLKMMNRLVLIVTALVLSCAVPARAQEENGPVDTLLAGRAIFDAMPEGVYVNQSSAVRGAMERQTIDNVSKKYSGFRVRIYLGSAQNSREASSRAAYLFSRLYPDTPVYRVYDSPNFRVTAGNFRTRTEAEAFARSIKEHFPSASVMREKFKYPSLGRAEMTARDTTETEIPLLFEE